MSHVVVVATGYAPKLAEVTMRESSVMLTFFGKPLIQHVVEMLASVKATRIDLILHEFPETVEDLLGNGERWGVKLNCHVISQPTSPVVLFERLTRGDDVVRVVMCTALPTNGYTELMEPPADVCAGRVFSSDMVDGADQMLWVAAERGPFFAALNRFQNEGGRGLSQLTEPIGEIVAEVFRDNLRRERPLGWGSYREIWNSWQRVMHGESKCLLVPEKSSEDGIWLGRNIGIHPSAKITPPVFIGDNVRIGENAIVGPYAVLAGDLILDRGSEVQNSLVLRDTYVGEGLSLDGLIAMPHLLVHVDRDVTTPVVDAFLLGSLASSEIPFWKKVVHRTIAGILLTVGLPILFLYMLINILRGRSVRWERHVGIHTPVLDNQLLWQTFGYYRAVSKSWFEGRRFFSHFLPGLFSVLKGDMFLVGVPPRSPVEVSALECNWRRLYLQSRPGLIVEPGVIYGTDRGPDESFAAEAFFVAEGDSLWHEMKLLSRYLFGRTFCHRMREEGV